MAKQALGPNQEKWLKALESGEFKQGSRRLENLADGSRCCLGVACAIFDEPRIVTEAGIVMFGSESCGSSGVLSQRLLRELALISRGGACRGTGS